MSEPVTMRTLSPSHSHIYQGSVCLATVRNEYAEVCLEAIKGAISDKSKHQENLTNQQST